MATLTLIRGISRVTTADYFRRWQGLDRIAVRIVIFGFVALGVIVDNLSGLDFQWLSSFYRRRAFEGRRLGSSSSRKQRRLAGPCPWFGLQGGPDHRLYNGRF